MVHSIHVSRHTVYWVQAQVEFGRVYFPGPNRVGARAHFMRWAQPIQRLSRRACVRANDGLASVNAGQPMMKNLSHFVKSVLPNRYKFISNEGEYLTLTSTLITLSSGCSLENEITDSVIKFFMRSYLRHLDMRNKMK